MTRLIALSGYAGAGKNEVARILAPSGWREVSFAEPLRAALYTLDPSLGDHDGHTVREVVDKVGWDTAKRSWPELRELLQRMGTEVGRGLFGQDFWVDQAMRSLEDGGRYVFTDCRFPNEADAIRSRGGRVWRIWRPDVTAVNGHPSETALDEYEFDRVIANDRSLWVLEQTVARALALT